MSPRHRQSLISTHVFEIDNEVMLIDPETFKATQIVMISALRERVQHLPVGGLSYEDLVWTDHNTCGKCKYRPG
jgi:hypothetical protein